MDGMNQKKPANLTLLTTIDISKAFDTVPKDILKHKIYNTTAHNNTKRWLANYITGRQALVEYNNPYSHTRVYPNGVPQGSVLSPSLFNLFLSDLPDTPPTEKLPPKQMMSLLYHHTIKPLTPAHKRNNV